MPITRQSKIDPIYTVAQLLSHLQIKGHLDGVDVSDWALGGTSVEELILALRALGSGRWLEEAYPYHGPLEAADTWIRSYLQGKEVADFGDLHTLENTWPPLFDIEDAFKRGMDSLDEYLDICDQDERDRLKFKFTAKPEFAFAMTRLVCSLADAVVMCALAEEQIFEEHRFLFLKTKFPIDPDLDKMIHFYLNCAAISVFPSFNLTPDQHAIGEKRLKSLLAKAEDRSASLQQ